MWGCGEGGEGREGRGAGSLQPVFISFLPPALSPSPPVNPLPPLSPHPPTHPPTLSPLASRLFPFPGSAVVGPVTVGAGSLHPLLVPTPSTPLPFCPRLFSPLPSPFHPQPPNHLPPSTQTSPPQARAVSSVVLGPVTVGAGSKVGAGSVVLSELPPHSVAVGVPARVIKREDSSEPVADMDQTTDFLLDYII